MASTLLKVHVTPRGSNNEIVGWREDVLYVKVTAPPVEGAANAAAIKLIADVLGLRKSHVELVSGKMSREKTLRVDGLTMEEIRAAV